MRHSTDLLTAPHLKRWSCLKGLTRQAARFLIVLLMTSAALLAGVATGDQAAARAQTSSVAAGFGLSDSDIRFREEFSGSSLDLGRWYHRRLGDRKNAKNVTDAVTVENGYLRIGVWTDYDDADGQLIHRTGIVATKNKWRYGYFETRVQVNYITGSWFGFWLQPEPVSGSLYCTPEGSSTPNDPRQGTEIDIIEILPKAFKLTSSQKQQGFNAVFAAGTHWGDYNTSCHNILRAYKPWVLDSQWYTVSALWTPDGVIMYIDGEEYNRFMDGETGQRQVYDQQMRIKGSDTYYVSEIAQEIILSMEVVSSGGAGTPPAGGYGSKADSPYHVKVDYVRVYDHTAHNGNTSGGGDSGGGGSSGGGTDGVASAITDLTATASGGTVTLEWTPDPDADEYYVYQIFPDDPTPYIGRTVDYDSTYTVGSRADGTYRYTVRPVVSGNSLEDSNIAELTISGGSGSSTTPAPDPVTDLTCTVTDWDADGLDDDARCNWTAVPGAGSYNVYVDDGSGSGYTYSGNASDNDNTVEDLADGTYDIIVRTLSSADASSGGASSGTESANSNISTVTITAGGAGGGAGTGAPTSQRPYLDTPQAVPGRLQPEYYDAATDAGGTVVVGQGWTYFDTDTDNRATGTNGFRADQYVDTGGTFLAWVRDGEYLDLTADVAEAGDYALTARVSTPQAGGQLDLSTVTVTGSAADGTLSKTTNRLGGVPVPTTGDWSVYTVTPGDTVTLAAGEQILRMEFPAGDFNVDWVELTPVAGGAVPAGPLRRRAEVPLTSLTPVTWAGPFNLNQGTGALTGQGDEVDGPRVSGALAGLEPCVNCSGVSARVLDIQTDADDVTTEGSGAAANAQATDVEPRSLETAWDYGGLVVMRDTASAASDHVVLRAQRVSSAGVLADQRVVMWSPADSTYRTETYDPPENTPLAPVRAKSVLQGTAQFYDDNAVPLPLPVRLRAEMDPATGRIVPMAQGSAGTPDSTGWFVMAADTVSGTHGIETGWVIGSADSLSAAADSSVFFGPVASGRLAPTTAVFAPGSFWKRSAPDGAAPPTTGSGNPTTSGITFDPQAPVEHANKLIRSSTLTVPYTNVSESFGTSCGGQSWQMLWWEDATTCFAEGSSHLQKVRSDAGKRRGNNKEPSAQLQSWKNTGYDSAPAGYFPNVGSGLFWSSDLLGHRAGHYFWVNRWDEYSAIGKDGQTLPGNLASNVAATGEPASWRYVPPPQPLLAADADSVQYCVDNPGRVCRWSDWKAERLAGYADRTTVHGLGFSDFHASLPHAGPENQSFSAPLIADFEAYLTDRTGSTVTIPAGTTTERAQYILDNHYTAWVDYWAGHYAYMYTALAREKIRRSVADIGAFLGGVDPTPYLNPQQAFPPARARWIAAVDNRMIRDSLLAEPYLQQRFLSAGGSVVLEDILDLFIPKPNSWWRFETKPSRDPILHSAIFQGILHAYEPDLHYIMAVEAKGHYHNTSAVNKYDLTGAALERIQWARIKKSLLETGFVHVATRDGDLRRAMEAVQASAQNSGTLPSDALQAVRDYVPVRPYGCMLYYSKAIQDEHARDEIEGNAKDVYLKTSFDTPVAWRMGGANFGYFGSDVIIDGGAVDLKPHATPPCYIIPDRFWYGKDRLPASELQALEASAPVLSAAEAADPASYPLRFDTGDDTRPATGFGFFDQSGALVVLVSDDIPYGESNAQKPPVTVDVSVDLPDGSYTFTEHFTGEAGSFTVTGGTGRFQVEVDAWDTKLVVITPN